MSNFVESIETRTQTMSWGAKWEMLLEKWTSPLGKTAKFVIYHNGGQSYPVGSFRSKKAALKMLNSFELYVKA